ncbi:ImpA family metalloprotease [Vibrio vulnificus]|uniref:ImpA family metalloprotease n=1 Tax=Vibrio vulnificus TaxID=672 RepID=UPI0015947E2E|nr:ImpA family metalloprotease [Vibrio vulnificus]
MNKIFYSSLLALAVTACGGGSGSGSGGGGSTAQVKTDVEWALESGNALLVSDPNEFIQASQRYVADYQQQNDAMRTQLAANASSLEWDPTHDAAIIEATYGFNQPILQTNKAMSDGYKDQELTIGVAGLRTNDQRYAVLGSNPFRTAQRFPTSVNSDMEIWLDNLLGWLNAGSLKQGANVVIAQMDQSHYFPDEQATRSWLTNRYGAQLSYNDANQCDGEKLLACVTAKPDLLILSQHMNSGDSVANVKSAVEKAQADGIPILYLHWDGGMTELGNELFDLFHVRYVGDNYWRKLGISQWNALSLNGIIPQDIVIQQALLNRFLTDSFTVDLTQCDDKSCPESTKMENEFYLAANAIRNHLLSLDRSQVDLFKTADYQYEKLMVLLADRYRQDVVFPMDKSTTASLEFLKSYFSDYVQYHSRAINPKQPNMGNFSRSEFGAEIARISKTVQLQSKRNFRSAGVYALPGETFQITRRDNSAVKVLIAINSLRSGATHEFSKEGYSRPKHLTSTTYEIKSGETIRLTSAYGGPIQVHFDTNDLPVELLFTNVAQHPVWRSADDNEPFTEQLNQDQFDWAELITPGFEVHSKREKMLQSISVPEWAGSAAAMAQATERYMHNFPHALAGFKGPGITVFEQVQTYGENKGWQVETIDIVKHMNADQATCGYGCSGNPYDAYWAFSPVGHGDLHELGHGLEKGRFRFAGWEGHSTTNYYSYYSKSQYFIDTGKESQCQSLDFKEQYDLLQQSRQQADPNAFMAAQNKTGWSWGARIYIQMMMAAQQQGILQDGWHLLGRLHLIEREFNRLKGSVELWDARKESIGFSQYSLDEANAISNNDWLLVALSYITERDMREYLNMWGFTFSDKAKQQVITHNHPVMPLNYFVSSNTGYCTTDFAKQFVPVDGVTAWPSN